MGDDVRSMALKFASMGLPVFRVKPDGKTPLDKEFYARATADPTIVSKRFTDVDGTPVNYNVGVLTGSSLPDGRKLHVIDVDVKNGKKGLETLEELKNLGLDTNTLTVRTASGGLHFYYGAPADWPELSSTAGKLGPGIDTRGYHGYVVGPGSSIGEKPYELVRNGKIATLEPWVLDRLKIRKEMADTNVWLVEPDQPECVERATEHARLYPAASEGVRNEQLLMLAHDIRGFGISEDLALGLIADHWVTADELGEVELEKTVRSAYKSARLPAGINTAAAQFDSLDIDVGEHPDAFEQKAKRKRRYGFLESAAMFRQIPPPLVKGLLTSGSMSVFYGPPSAGKTFVVLDLAHAIASGRDWFGHKVRQGAVLYQVGEGGFGFHGRLEGLRIRYNSPDIPLFHYAASLDLFNGNADAKAIVQECKDVLRETGQKVELIVIDTLARAMGGGDENSSQEIGKVIKTLDIIREHTGAHILLIHHTGKDVSRGARGSNALKGAIDTEIEIIDNVIHVTRQRDLESGQKTAFKLAHIKIGADDEGANIETRIVEPDPNASPSQPDPPRQHRRAPPGFDVKAQQFFDAVRLAWDSGAPFNDSPQAIPLKRNLTTRAMGILDVSRNKAKELLDVWKDAGHLKIDMRDSHAKMKGYRVVSTPWDDQNDAEMTAEMTAEMEELFS